MKIKIILPALFSYSVFIASAPSDHVNDLKFTIQNIFEKVLCTTSKEYNELCAELSNAWIDFKSIPEQDKLYNQYKRIYCKFQLKQNGESEKDINAAYSAISKLSKPSEADCEICNRFFEAEKKLKECIKKIGILDVRASSKDIEQSIKFTNHSQEINEYMTNLKAKKKILDDFDILIIEEKEKIQQMYRNCHVRKMQEIKEIKNEKSKRKTKEKGRNYNRRGMQEIKEMNRNNIRRS